jgi:hypothetical protein
MRKYVHRRAPAVAERREWLQPEVNSELQPETQACAASTRTGCGGCGVRGSGWLPRWLFLAAASMIALPAVLHFPAARWGAGQLRIPRVRLGYPGVAIETAALSRAANPRGSQGSNGTSLRTPLTLSR